MTKTTRKNVLAHLRATGPRVSIASLSQEFSRVARRELADLLRRYRYWARRTHIDALQWTTVGAVWAVDFTEAPCRIDGTYPYILAVRDLASGQQLLALPTRDQSAATVCQALASLLAQHGRPLLIKSDNGSAFKAAETRAFLEQHGVCFLPSPPRTPSYNGACEAGIGSLKTHCHEIASARGAPAAWSCNDVEAARLQANVTSHPSRDNHTTAQQTWKHRPPIDADERATFHDAVRAFRMEVKRQWGYSQEDDICPATRDRVEREVFRRVLVARGYLVIRRRRITLPLKRLKAAKIT